METPKIVIVNPKSKKIIKELVELNMISIHKNQPTKAFQNVINKLRNKSATTTLVEITSEVELVRAKRYEKKVLSSGYKNVTKYLK